MHVVGDSQQHPLEGRCSPPTSTTLVFTGIEKGAFPLLCTSWGVLACIEEAGAQGSVPVMGIKAAFQMPTHRTGSDEIPL